MDAALLQMSRMAPVALPSLAAIGAAMSSTGAAALSAVSGVLASIPVVGWIALAVVVVVVLVVVFWDDVCDFFSAIWDWLTQMATIAYEWVATVATTWVVDTVEDVWSPKEIDSKRIRTALDAATALLAAAALAETIKHLDNVYEIVVFIPGRYIDLLFRKKNLIAHIPNEIPSLTYKYGTTSKAITARYPTSLYVGYHLAQGNFAVYWHHLNIDPLYLQDPTKKY